MNAGKSKVMVMVGSSGGKTIVNSGKWPCGVCGKLAATASIRNGWINFRDLLPFLTSSTPSLEMKGPVYASCVRSSITYGSETRPLLADVELKFERAEMQMIRWMCGVSLKDRRTSQELRKLVGVIVWPCDEET